MDAMHTERRARVRAMPAVVTVALAAACSFGGPDQSVDKQAYVAENDAAIAFLEHPPGPQRRRQLPLGGEGAEVVTGYLTIIESSVPAGVDPFLFYAEQLEAAGWGVGCTETPLEGGEMARQVDAADDQAYARVNASETQVTVSVDHAGVGSGNGTADQLAWHCSIPPP